MTAKTIEEAADELENPRYVLRLFVTGMTPRSTRAIRAVRDICQELLEGRFQLEIDGERLTRADFEDYTPAILVESPLPFQDVTSPVRASGTANTFEANFNYELTDTDGRIVDENFVTATSGTGTRGTFEFTTKPFTITLVTPSYDPHPDDGGGPPGGPGGGVPMPEVARATLTLDAHYRGQWVVEVKSGDEPFQKIETIPVAPTH